MARILKKIKDSKATQAAKQLLQYLCNPKEVADSKK